MLVSERKFSRGLSLSLSLIFLVTLIAYFILTSSLAFARNSGNKVKLRMLIGGDQGGWKVLKKRFEEKYPNIEIILIEGPPTTDTRENMYTVSFVARKGYDLVFMDVVWMAKFAAAGWLEPLDDYIKRDKIDFYNEFFPGDIEASTYNGHIYRMPVQSDFGVLYYRKDWLNDFGYTEEDIKTWNDVKRIGKEIAEKLSESSPRRVYGFVFQGKQYEGLVCDFMEILWAFGGDLVKENKVVLYSPESVKALSFLRSLLVEGVSPQSVVTYEEEESKNAFENGMAVFLRNWPYVSISWVVRKSDFMEKAGLTMLPGEKDPDQPGSPTLGGWGLGISAFSPYKEEAWKFIKFVIDPESQKILYEYNTMLPARKVLYDDPELIAKNKYFPIYKRALSRARPRPKHPAYARISDLIQFYVSSALVGRFTPDEAILRLDKALRKLY